MNLPQQVVNAIWLGSVYSLFALGYALVFSVLGVLNLAHSAVFTWGAFIALTAVLSFSIPIPLAALIGMLGAGIISYLLEKIAFQPLRKRDAPRISQLISSIGAAIFLVALAERVFGTTVQRFPLGSIPNNPIAGLPFSVTPIQIIVLIAALGLMLLLQALIQRTKMGMRMRAVAYNARTASLLGVNVNRVYGITFFIAGALAGAAGTLFGLAYNSMDPSMGEGIALKGLTVIVLGGMGNIKGAVLGGFIVAAIEVFSIAFLRSNFRDAIVYLLLFLILLVRPQGLIGQKEQTRA